MERLGTLEMESGNSSSPPEMLSVFLNSEGEEIICEKENHIGLSRSNAVRSTSNSNEAGLPNYLLTLYVYFKAPRNRSCGWFLGFPQQMCKKT